MADAKVQLHNSLDSKLYPATTLDNIVLSVDSSTTYIASGGKIKANYLAVANGTASGIVYNNDTSHLTITNGGIQINVQTNIGTASTAAEQAKIPTAGAVQSCVSSQSIIPQSAVNGLTTDLGNKIGAAYVSSANIIPMSAVNGLTTSLGSKIDSSYVSSANVIPTSAINGLSTAITNGAGSYVVSNAVAKSNVTSDYGDIKNATDVSTEIPNVYAVNQYKNDFMEDLQSELETYYQLKMSAGFGAVISGGTKIELARTRAVTTINAASTTVTMQPGEFYIIDATTTSKTLNIGTVGASKFGLDTYLELFVANGGYVHCGSNVTLIDALEPDSVNNCIVRFHDGNAIISVRDHVAAYMVHNTSTTSATAKSLPYGLKQNYKYIGFWSELNGSTIPTGGVSVTTAKYIVGNGTTVGPTVSGSVGGSVTFRDVKLSNLTLTGGVATFGEVNVLSGAVVSAVAGTANLQHVEGEGKIVVNSSVGINGAKVDCYVQAVSGLPIIGSNSTFNLSGSGVLDLAGTKITTSGTNAKINITGMTITSGGLSTTNGGGFLIQNAGSGYFSGCLFAYNSSTNYGGAIYITKGSATLINCSVLNNDATIGQAIMVQSGIANLVDCDFRHARGNRAQNIALTAAGTVSIAGTCRFTGVVSKANASAKGTLIISSGAVVDLSGNSISVPIIPGGSIIINGACTIVDSAGVDKAVAGGTYTQITNAGAVS